MSLGEENHEHLSGNLDRNTQAHKEGVRPQVSAWKYRASELEGNTSERVETIM